MICDNGIRSSREAMVQLLKIIELHYTRLQEASTAIGLSP